MIEALFEVLFEFVFQLIGELFFESITQRWSDGQRQHPIVAILGYGLLGGLIGALSVTFMPHHLIRDLTLRRVNLVVSPLLAGWFMMLVGSFRVQRGRERVRLDRFAYAALFAFGMALARYVFAD